MEQTYTLIAVDRFGGAVEVRDVVGADGTREVGGDLLCNERVHRVDVMIGAAHVDTLTRMDLGIVLG